MQLRPKFDFDDILTVPEIKTHVTSRYKDIELPDKLPLFTAPMDTVVDLKNMNEFLKNGIHVTLPRTVKYEDIEDLPYGVFVSMGFEDLDFYYRHNFEAFHESAHILIDVANGHMQKIIDYAREIKRLRPDVVIMAGNIGNPLSYKHYAKYGCVDYIRIGIGNGNGCLTTKQSGIGYPMASLIKETALVKEDLLKNEKWHGNIPKIVADGGMKDYSDITKSLALGADYVMVGSIFNKAFESAAPNYLYGVKLNKRIAKYLFKKNFPIKKYFRGMSTKEAQKAMGKSTFKTSEGVTRFRKVEYYLKGWVENFEHYLRNAMSYVNAKSLDAYVGKPRICMISKNAYDRFNK
jgi:IMP dehydrogenase/GMP reductase